MMCFLAVLRGYLSVLVERTLGTRGAYHDGLRRSRDLLLETKGCSDGTKAVA